jgi:hypothetical protein
VGDNYFASPQDATLVAELQQLMHKAGVHQGSTDVRRTLCANFHGLEYHGIRAMLEGCRNLLSWMSTSSNNNFESVRANLKQMVQATDDSQFSARLQDIGFPQLKDQQSQLLLSLDDCQFRELVSYLGYQLASEGHVFSSLPLYMTQFLIEEDSQEIHRALNGLCEQRGDSSAASHVDEFVHHVLRFYERQVCDGAMKKDQPLRDFLRENNFCDTSDPVFAVLPSSVTSRQYVSLQQLLHQIKLKFRFRMSKGLASDEAEVGDPPHDGSARTRRGHCWLWEEDDGPKGADTAEKDDEMPDEKWKLWFEIALPGIVENGMDVVPPAEEQIEVEPADPSMAVDTEEEETKAVAVRRLQHWWRRARRITDNEESDAARLLQRWWRRQLEDMQNFMDVESVVLSEPNQLREDAYGNDDERSELLEDAESNSSPPPALYGGPEEEQRMRQWLNDHLLPQSVADKLSELGARTVADVVMLVREFPGEVEKCSFPFLDRQKLENAVAEIS